MAKAKALLRMVDDAYDFRFYTIEAESNVEQIFIILNRELEELKKKNPQRKENLEIGVISDVHSGKSIVEG